MFCKNKDVKPKFLASSSILYHVFLPYARKKYEGKFKKIKLNQ